MVAAVNHVLQKTTVVFSESKLVTRFQTLRFPANKQRTRELDNWKKKNCPNSATEWSSTERSPAVAALLWKRRDWTVQPLVFLISCWRFILLALVFEIFVWQKAVAIAVAFHCCGLYIERAVKNKTTNGGYRLVWETLNCWMFNIICFLTSYGMIYVFFHSWFCIICFNRATASLFVSATHFFELWRPWRMNMAQVLCLWTRFFQPGSIYFCLTSLILLKQLFLSGLEE